MPTNTDVLQIKLETSGDGKVKASIAGVGKSIGTLDTESVKATRSSLSLATALKGVAAGFVIFKAGELVSGLIAINKEFDSLEASLTTVTGSEAKAAQAFDNIQEFASTTPFQLNEVTNAFIKLTALGLDPSDAALRSYGNTASGMGKSLNDMIEAIADAATGEFERLKEFGIKASVQGDQVKLRFRGVTTTIGNNAAEIEGYLRRIGNVEFAGGMERQMDTLGGGFSNLEDSTAKFARAIGEGSGFNESLKSATHWLTEFLNSASEGVNKLAGLPRSIKTIEAEIALVTTRLERTTSARGRRGGLSLRLKELADELQEARVISNDIPQLSTAIAKINSSIVVLETAISDTPQDRRVATVGGGRSKRASQYALLNRELSSLVDQRKTILARMAELDNDNKDNGGGTTTIAVNTSGYAEAEALTRSLYIAQEILADDLLRLNGMWQSGKIDVETYGRAISESKQNFDDATDSGTGFIEMMAQGEQIIRDMQTPQEAFADEILRLNGLWQAGAIDVETYGLAILDAQQQIVDDAQEKSLQWADAWSSAGNRFAAGIGNAVADVLLEQQNFADALRSIVKGVVRSVISGLVEIGVKKVLLAGLEKSTLAAQTGAVVGSAAVIGSAMATPAALASLATLGSNAVPAAAGIASTVALSESLALAGIAHSGLDYVPREGTYLLQRGEMVLDPGTSAAVRNSASNASTERPVVVNMPITNNAINSQGIAGLLKSQRGLINSMVIAAVNEALNASGRRGLV